MVAYIPKTQMSQNHFYDFNFFNKTNDFHWSLAFFANQWIYFIHFLARSVALALLIEPNFSGILWKTLHSV